jgi:SAM-dependent methyltransferase
VQDQAYKQYASESRNWLKQGRSLLVRDIIRSNKEGTDATLLEVGAGVGQNLDVLSEFISDIEAVEINAVGIEALREKQYLGSLYEKPIPFAHSKRYDFIIALDVLEHIEDDSTALKWMVEHLNEGGLLICTVPAYQWLFTKHDQVLNHFRRYTKTSLRNLIPPQVRIRRLHYYNSFLFPLAVISRLLWSISTRIGKHKDMAKQSSEVNSLGNKVLSLILKWENAAISAGLKPPFGLSVVCVLEKI